jgi:ligand-binding SRPBCC domain-containing protein
MKLNHIKRNQFLPITLNEAWDFFSSPKNLIKITPANMIFNIDHFSGDQKMYPGQIICYTIKVLPGYTTNWVTEITHVSEPFYFIDEQRFGPYALWNHQHFFKPVEHGTEMTDEISYAIPYGVIGSLANKLFVARRINAIFDYRFQALEKIFPSR